MPLQVITTISPDFFSHQKKSGHANADRKLRIIIKEKGGNWQDTVLRSEGGLPVGTKWVMNCFPGSKIPHDLVRRVGSVRSLDVLESDDSGLRQFYENLQEHRNTSPVTVPSHRYEQWYRFVNEKVWIKFHKLTHSLSEPISVDPELTITSDEWQLYQTVNKKYAKALARDIISDLLARRTITLDINWLHDYQLMLVFHYLEEYLPAVIEEVIPSTSDEDSAPRYSEEEQQRLKNALPRALNAIKTSYFHHIPWPDVDTFTAEFPIIPNGARASLPEDDDSDDELAMESVTSALPETSLNTGKEIINGLLSSNHIAFQTKKDASNFIDCVRFYYPEARLESRNVRHKTIYLPTKELDIYVNPIGTDYRLFATSDLSDQAIIDYYSKLLGVSMVCEEALEEGDFELRLEELTEAALTSYLKAIVELLIVSLRTPKGLTDWLNDYLTPDHLQKETIQQTRFEVVAEFQANGIEDTSMLDQFFNAVQQSLNSLQKAKVDLLSDYRTLQPLWAFKSRTPGVQLFSSIGRLDPEKNVPTLLDAYLTYIQQCVSTHQPIKHSLLLFIVPSRLEVQAYQQELNTIMEKFLAIKHYLAEHGLPQNDFVYLAEETALQEAVANPGKTPSKPKLISPNAMVEFYRLGPVVISSRADGMNLVVKEWVGAQDGLIQRTLQGLFNFVKGYPDSLMSRAMTQEEKSMFSIYARALQQTFAEHPYLSSVITKLGLNFSTLLTEFFTHYDEEIPALPMLSRNAGAAAQLKQACIIDPLNPETLLQQFQHLDELDPIVRVARALELKNNVQHENGQEWRRDMVDQVLAKEAFSDSSRHIAQRIVKKDGLIFIDYDGTISPHVPNPDEAWPELTARSAILALMKVAADQIIFITGRDIPSFLRCFWGGLGREEQQKIPLTVIGSHGLEIQYRDGSKQSLVAFSDHERAFIASLRSDENILALKQKMLAILQPYLSPELRLSMDELIEIKQYSIALLTAPIRHILEDDSLLDLIEDQFAELLKTHFLISEKNASELTHFSVWRGIHICELRFNHTKADAIRTLLKDKRYSTARHLAFLGDDFGQLHQPGTDYSLAAWINEENSNPNSPYEGMVIQVMSDERRPSQKQLLSSPARPYMVLQSPLEVGNWLARCAQYAFEANSRHALITHGITQLTQRFPEHEILLPSETQAIELDKEELFDAGPEYHQGLIKL